MDPKLKDKLIVAISSRALFDLDEAHQIFDRGPIEEYRQHQVKHENDRLAPGTGFPLVKGLSSIKDHEGRELVEVVLVSRNDADTGLRVMNSIEQYDLPITRAVFTDGRPPYDYLAAFSCHLFLSANPEDVAKTIEKGFASGLVYKPPFPFDPDENEVRIAFDGDAVLFSGEAEQVYSNAGLEEFHRQEQASAEVPLNPGPFKAFLEALHRIQKILPDPCPIRTALVTARSAPAHKRPVKTLRAWSVRMNEAFFLGGVDKSGVLESFRPHIFFDDQDKYCQSASSRLPTAQVPTASRSPGVIANPTDVEPVNGTRVKRKASRSSGRRRRPKRTEG